MSVKNCPFCAEEIAAEAIKCKHCGSMLDGRAPVFDYPPTIVTAPIVISACWNAMTAIVWGVFVPCLGLFVAIPLAALAIYEYTTFRDAAEMPPRELHERCGLLAVLQILLGFSNALLPVVCGVLLLVYRDKLLMYEETPPL